MLGTVTFFGPPVLLCLLVLGFSFSGLPNGYLLGHVSAEFSTIFLGWMIAATVWKTRTLRPNSLLNIYAGGLVWVGIIDFLHLLSFEGMQLMPSGGTNLAASLWVCARAIQAATMLIAVLAASRSVHFAQPFLGFGIASLILVSWVFSGAFPTAYVPGVGLTAFKRAAEFGIIIVALAALALSIRFRADSPQEKPLVLASIVLFIMTEAAFTSFVSAFDWVNMLGHLFKIWCFWLLFAAAVEVTVVRPAAAQQLLSAVVEQSPAGIMVTTPDGVIEYVNPRFETDSGYTAEEAVGRRADFLQAEGMSQQITETMWRTIQQGQIWSGEFLNQRKDGTIYSDRSIIFSIRNVDGQIVRYVAFKEDVTAKRQVEDYLVDQDNAVTRMLVGSLDAMIHMLESRDPYTAGHARSVATVANLIAERIGLQKGQTEALRLAALVHNIGQIKVPLDILNKPGKLTPQEFALIREHPQTAYDALKDIPFPWDVPRIVLCHHEKWDGSGYPNGIAGEQIPLEAQILSVADVLVAVSNHRPYRTRRRPDAAFDIIQNGIGTSFSPIAAGAALDIRDQIEPYLVNHA